MTLHYNSASNPLIAGGAYTCLTWRHQHSRPESGSTSSDCHCQTHVNTQKSTIETPIRIHTRESLSFSVWLEQTLFPFHHRCQMNHLTVGLVLLLTLMFQLPSATASISAVYSQNNLDIQHMVLSPSGEVYVGAKNRILRLSSDFALLEEVTTGPYLDNEGCMSTFISQGDDICYPAQEAMVSTDNHNKLLLVDTSRQKLVVCSSIFQGLCDSLPLNRISENSNFMIQRSQSEIVVANTADTSTVGIIAPGHVNGDIVDVLYTGVEFSGVASIRSHRVAAVSSRNLDNFEYVYDNKESTGEITYYEYENSECITSSYISYVHTFSHNGYTYFLTIQHKSLCADNSPFVSKIAQVCQSDDTYSSYLEMPLKCGSYNLLQTAALVQASETLAGLLNTFTGDYVLVGSFARSETNSNVPTSSSAVCMFLMSDIREMVRFHINNCYSGIPGGSGVGTSPLFHSEGASLACVSTSNSYVPDSNFCGSGIPVNLAMYNESVGPTSTPMLTINGFKFTAITAQNVNSYTVFYMGTDEGTLKKIFFYPPSQHVEYETVSLGSNAAVLQDIFLSADMRSIYLTTLNQVSKVSVANCSRFSSCTECLYASDPHCGWCTLENKCSWKVDCLSSNSYLRWLSMTESTCTAISAVTPTSMDVDGTSYIDISIQQLPTSLNEEYACVLGDVEFPAVVGSSTLVRCNEPSSYTIPQILNGQYSVDTRLAVKSVSTGVVFVETPYTFHRCDALSDCNSCVSTPYGCRWCTYSNRCSYSAASCDHNMLIVGSFEWCPQMTQLMEPQIILPSGVSSSFTLVGKNLPFPLGNQDSYECLFEFTTPALRVSAVQINSTHVTCNGFNHALETLPAINAGILPSDVKVIWNYDYEIFQASSTLVYIYDCSQMAADCGECFNIQSERSEYGCAYCGGLCNYTDTCTTAPSSSCPLPMDVEIYPLTGPIEGGTRVTITGSNLGSSYAEIANSVEIAGQPCDIIPEDYVPSRTIVCVTRDVPMVTSGLISITIGDLTTEFARFHYQNPILEDIEPYVGPMDGGTEITIIGVDLDTGSDIRAEFVSNLNSAVIPCDGARYTSLGTRLFCTTTAVLSKQVIYRLNVYFDDAERQLVLSPLFNYTNNPTITDIYPITTYQDGGRTVTVQGRLLNVVQHPKMILTQGSLISSTTDCIVHSENKLTCPSPPAPSVPGDISLSRRRRRQTGEDEPVRVALLMDSVRSVRDLQGSFSNITSVFTLVPSPNYNDFEGSLSIFAPNSGGFLVLEGSDLNLACDLDEVRVMIGEEVCIVDSLSSTRLLCKPPEAQPMGVNTNGQLSASRLPEVKITVSDNLEFRPGELRYAAVDGDLPLIVIILIAVGGGFFIVVILSIIIVYHRKSKEAQRKIKKMLIQLDMLESNVRNECKQAFAELQTEVTDLTSDLTLTGIPFWDFHTYSFKVLFPSHTDHPILHTPQSEFNESKVGYEQGLQQFNQLLNSKQFLITFIRTLEQQKNFSIRDRAVVASLLMVVLQDKMEYATEILKALLNELIDKSVERRNPKLLFRRTESVVEKFLTNWLSLCMYDYLKKHAGRPIFILYKAIKQQTDKGPVDALTGEARYSLSEDRLLREKIEPKVLNILLMVENGQEPVQCKMLDCDTVTQAKEKALNAVYMNTPFSRRPSVFDVDLEWRSGRHGHLPLQDEDVTTEMHKGWKRINTLAHYHVADGATMALLPKRFKNDYVRQVHGMVEITSGSSLTTLTPIITVEEGTKVWHLTKHDDSHNQSRHQKVISEIFLTRLLTTKGTMQQYVDDLFLTILKVDNQLPTAVKFLFDFLDQAARRHNIVDPEVVHTWKSNSLPLRFWVNILKNPEFVFDINKPHIVDSCLSVIAQTFMDSCSTSEHRLGKDSPTNKLLFAKDIPKYRKWVEKYYKDVSDSPPVSDHDMNVAMTELSMNYIVDFNIGSALKELFKYASHYNYELLEALDNDPSAKKLHLAHKFDQINMALDGTGGTLY